LNSIFFHQYFFNVCERIYVTVKIMISFLHVRNFQANEIIIQNSSPARKQLVKLICIPLCVAAFLSFLSVILFKDQLPRNFDASEWRTFAVKVQQTLHADNNRVIVVLAVVVVDILQVVFAFPLLHVTKVFAGYVFGTVVGFLICVSVEMICVIIVVFLCEKNQKTDDALPKNLSRYFDAMRKSLQFYVILAALQMSGIPLLSLTPLILTKSVSKTEFIFSHFIVCSVMTIKDTFLGAFIASPMHNAAYKISIASGVLLVSTVLPTLCTIFLMAHLTRVCMSVNNAYAMPENMEDVCPLCGEKETNESMCICDSQALLEARQAEVDIENDVENDVENSVHDIESEQEKNKKKEDA
jgi:uncharacterized membrane protein YdjX (TVP38/TMEM64 family)